MPEMVAIRGWLSPSLSRVSFIAGLTALSVRETGVTRLIIASVSSGQLCDQAEYDLKQIWTSEMAKSLQSFSFLVLVIQFSGVVPDGTGIKFLLSIRMKMNWLCLFFYVHNNNSCILECIILTCFSINFLWIHLYWFPSTTLIMNSY